MRSGVRFWCVSVMAGFSIGTALGAAGQWKSFTAKREIRALAFDRGVIWAATSGGMFSYRVSDRSFQNYTTSEGLKSIDLTAITSDPAGAIWIGSGDGFLHRFYPPTGQWTYFTDIASLSNPRKTINALQVRGDTLFILSELGVSVFSISERQFVTTFNQFGSGPTLVSGGVTSLAIADGNYWIGTHGGVATTPQSNPNPSSPESWRVYTTADGLPSNAVSSIGLHAGKVLAGTQNGLAAFGDSLWSVVPGTSAFNVIGFRAQDPACPACPSYILTPNELWSLSAAMMLDSVAALPAPLTVLLDSAAVGTSDEGILLHQGSDWSPTFPPGPPSNKFVGIAVDASGAVWSGTGTAFGEGFMRYDGTSWRSYTQERDSRLGTDNYYKVSIGRDDAKWVSSWGAGIALLDAGGTVRKVLGTSNGLPPSVPNSPSFVVVGGVAADADGVTWITNRTGAGDTSVVKFNPDSSVSYVLWTDMRTPVPIVFTDVVIDQNDTKWFSNSGRFEPTSPLGLFYYNDRFSLPGTSGGWGELTTADGLTSNKIFSLLVDVDGELWIGTDQGISIVYNTADPRGTMAPYHPLQDQIIQGMVADPLNNKWIATNQGVFVLASDGTSILARYTVASTDGKLLDDDVASIAIDGRNGTVYFGSEKGLSSLQTPGVTPKPSFEELALSPNPYYLPSAVPLNIDGLVQGSSLKILTVDGSLVKELQTPGGRVGFWDGTNERGEMVATAVYLVVAYSEDGSKVATGKVAVIRR